MHEASEANRELIVYEQRILTGSSECWIMHSMRMHFLGALELIQVIREENSEKHVYASSWSTLQDLIFLFFLFSCFLHCPFWGQRGFRNDRVP